MTNADLPRRSRGNSNDSVRQHNLSVVLRSVHHSGGLSRSAITAGTGLNRSTIAAIAAELVERGLVVEVGPGASTGVGRPSPVLRPSDGPVGIAVNPEIDAITVAAVGLGGRVVTRRRYDTGGPLSATDAAALTVTAIAEVRAAIDAQHRVVGVGVAMPGLVRAGDGLVRLAPHLRWTDEPFVDAVAAGTGLPVVAGNDASLGALAEFSFGAGRGETDMVYLNGGASGIGGGVITGGVPFGGVDGYGGEFGHTFVNSAGVQCHCGATGCLETEVRRSTLLRLVGLSDAAATQLEAAMLSATSDDLTTEIHRQLGFLAIALRNAINVLNPGLIVLGGFLGSLYATDPDYLDGLVSRQALRAPRETVRITRAALGPDILMIGAAELALEPVLSDPLRY
ncbi:ROK family transcriptional regulator [Marisediminicola senii]|uniref:ROK family transcriptional regulator n=1 Tax=Marisediminicola senii TaxID=2711233 RepID=UPI001F44673A|nr:ROK family transcriptional regulator [Marisediminicola senii]